MYVHVGVNPLTSSLFKRNKTDIAAIASVLKQYFRELADPLFPQDSYSAFIKSASMYIFVMHKVHMLSIFNGCPLSACRNRGCSEPV